MYRYLRLIKTLIKNRSIPKKCALKLFFRNEILNSKISDVAFILGAGSSINKLSSKDWDVFREGYTIGINHFVMHKFLPNCYFIESAKSEYINEIIINNVEIRSKDIKKYNINVFMEWSPNRANFNHFFDRFRQLIGDKCLFCYGCYELADEKEYLYRDILKVIDSCNVQKYGLFPWKRATIEKCIYYSVMLGYKDIILVGIDLDGPYFYSDSKELNYGVRIPQQDAGIGVHNTDVLRKGEEIKVSDVIKNYDTILRARGGGIYLYDKSSRLYPDIPLYKR